MAIVGLAAAQPALGSYASNPYVQHLHFQYGPLPIIPGQNLIALGPNLAKPAQDGYFVGMRASLVRADGTTPPVTEIHLHHGVWLNASRADNTVPGLPERFFAAGEEKTYAQIPDGYGYAYRASDLWLMNYMIHNLMPNQQTVYITYDIDFVPASSQLARSITPVRPIWMDVRNGEIYPVFDAFRGYAHNGVFTYPADQANAYAGARPRNEWTVDRAGTLVWAAGHLHPGGLFDELELSRAGATPAAARPAVVKCAVQRTRTPHKARPHSRTRARPARRRPAKRRVHCTKGAVPLGPVPGWTANSVRIFHSDAVNYDPNGRVSWDMSMTTSPPDWRIALRPGDKLRVRAAYDVSRGSWYESMGIMIAWMADADRTGANPFTTPVATTGSVTHGPLPENAPGGGVPQRVPDPATLPDTAAALNTVDIADFEFLPGSQTLSGALGAVPTIRYGQQLSFVNLDAATQIYHTITACRQPCTASYGASYPLADGTPDFDSGQLGFGVPGLTAAANRVTWSTPGNLQPGTYTFFCRIHPWMRGAFRVLHG